MTRWRFLLPLLTLAACRSNPHDNAPGSPPKNEIPASVQELYKQVNANPDSAGLRLQLVDALDSAGAGPQAMVQMDSLIRKDSLNYGLWFRKALLQRDAKDTTGALHSFRNAIHIYPAADAQLAAADLLAGKKDATALLLTKQVAEQRIGREYTAHCDFINGIYYARTGQTKKALESFNACIYNDFNYAEAYMEKGFIYYQAKQYKEAVQVFQTLVKIRNTYADGFYWLGKCYETMGDKAAAIPNYQRALTLDPGIKEAAAALQRLGAG
ncbi:MAG: tetratricopeptide repeat protein [Chitinophagaceae bacterium]|nr:tetratricopeptide repeat protein [Chitinophagaceae bacterium]